MAKKPVLVVMAAGMGSRYGGLKQIDPVGTCGEAILDFSLFDAHAAGFETAVIIIKEAIAKDFLETVGKRLEKCPMEIRYAYQELHKIPEGFTVPAERTKPWGTCHAVMCAKEAIDGAPFGVINADDYYGKSAFRVLYDALSKADNDSHDYCMVGYRLGNTVTENGSVARGVCQTNEDGYLVTVDELTRIETYEGGIHYTKDDGATWHDLPSDALVSMNMWGYTATFMKELEERFPAFLTKAIAENPAKAEFYLPVAIAELLAENKATVKVLSSPDRWYGVTYAADKPQVVAALREMTARGDYPDGLWK